MLYEESERRAVNRYPNGEWDRCEDPKFFEPWEQVILRRIAEEMGATTIQPVYGATTFRHACEVPGGSHCRGPKQYCDGKSCMEAVRDGTESPPL